MHVEISNIGTKSATSLGLVIKVLTIIWIGLYGCHRTENKVYPIPLSHHSWSFITKHGDRIGKHIHEFDSMIAFYLERHEIIDSLFRLIDRTNHLAFREEIFGLDPTQPFKERYPEDLVFAFSEGYARLVRPGLGHKTGYINKEGDLVIKQIYDDAMPFHEGLAAVRIENMYGFIDTLGEIRIEPQFSRVEFPGFVSDLAFVEKWDYHGYINRKGDFIWKSRIR